MLLVGWLNFSIHFSFHLHIGYAVAQDIEQSFRTAHRGQYAIGGCKWREVGLIFRTGVDDLAVIILQNVFLGFGTDRLVWEIFMIRSHFVALRIFFTETVEGRRNSSACAIEGSLHRHDASHGVIFHVVGENHQLYHVEEASKLLVRKSLMVHSRTFCHHAPCVVGFLHLYEA